MRFGIGSSVVVLPLGRKRGVVVEAGRGGHYRVQMENATVACREDDLEAAAEPRGTARARDRRRGATAAGSHDEPAAPPGRVDLHGLTVDEALARAVEEIDRALRRGADRVEVVHGKGSGRIRAALHRALKTLPGVASFSLDPGNPGVTWVYF